MFGDVVSAGAIGVVPVAGESLSKDRIERFLHASAVDNHVKKRILCFIGTEYGIGRRTEV